MSISVGRGYATKLDYQVTRERLEKYVEERGCVPRDRAMQDVIQVRGTGSYAMNTGQVGQLVKYSKKRGGITSFVLNGQYFLTTVDNMNEFTSGNWKEVNAKAREPKDNFLASVIARGREKQVSKKQRARDETTGRYKKRETNNE